ncbi:DapH/DapD/GlmU-related protein [Acetivibrio ethanolgignens]|uniref:Galactoside O-acetyltransferase n=1 Tax=Acetivibrio ethanolgignens TaxID=290052 RepID=A0A0V8QDZ8_9FIRM|nr:DapH/DapD/GlmU-related protein [Acetivibrio ethanolgignens]KSV58811.1 galactoside O-acetyltransferase [Acetivibrio ethanolgignens]
MWKIKKCILEKLDGFIFNFLQKNSEIMPKRFCKMIAYYYTDARIRKLYWKRLNVHMGEGTYSNLGMIAVNSPKTEIRIGKNVSIAPYVTFVGESDANNGEKILQVPYLERIRKSERIIVEDEVWIGANVTILPGVHIGTCAVIGAGSVVTKDVDSYSIWAGVPAKKIRDILYEESDDERK